MGPRRSLLWNRDARIRQALSQLRAWVCSLRQLPAPRSPGALRLQSRRARDRTGRRSPFPSALASIALGSRTPQKRQLCRPVIENVACKVLLAYRKITGIKLEARCPALTYTIYQDAGDWPHKDIGACGFSYKCQVDYMAQYSILWRSDLGPYDVHEILHHYHFGLPPLPNQHSLFGPAMLEARREIGDERGYGQAMARARAEVTRVLGNAQGRFRHQPRRVAMSPRVQWRRRFTLTTANRQANPEKAA